MVLAFRVSFGGPVKWLIAAMVKQVGKRWQRWFDMHTSMCLEHLILFLAIVYMYVFSHRASLFSSFRLMMG